MVDYMTAGQLKKALEGVPDDAEVRVQRVEDIYFEERGWDKCVKRLPFGFDIYEDEYSEYMAVFSAYLHGDDNVFVLNPHY
jgi:hypothetical protein